jgi:hypothetical protein
VAMDDCFREKKKGMELEKCWNFFLSIAFEDGVVELLELLICVFTIF